MENIKPTPFNDPLIESKLEEIRKYPELIHKITEWKSVSLCYYCLNELPNNYEALKGHYFDDRKEASKWYCPHCLSSGEFKYLSGRKDEGYWVGFSFLKKRLPHYVVRKRNIITGYEKSWFSKKPIFFTETQLILDNSK